KAWGEAMLSNTNYIFLGGMFIGFASLISVFFLFTKKNENIKNLKPWILIGLIVLLGTILTMLSDRTPFLKIMSIILPWFFKIPFPHYYHFLQHWSMALLAVIGIFLIFKIIDIKSYIKKYIIIIFILALIILVSISLFEKNEYMGEIMPGFKTIKLLGRLQWFLFEPVMYISVSLILLIVFTYLIKNNKLKYLLVSGIFLETVIFSYIVFYRGDISASAPWDYEPNDTCFASRFKSPADHPYYQHMFNLKDKIDKKFRYTGTITYIDNFAWIYDRYSLFGYDTKPVIKSMYDVMTKFMEGYPYQMVPICYPLNFLKNMNVGYLVFKRYGETKIDMETANLNGIEYNCIKTTDDLYSEPENKSLIMNIIDPLPYIYTQDKIKKMDLNEQMEKLITQNLKKIAYIEPDNQSLNNFIKNDRSEGDENEFKRLQESNKIISIDRNYANKLSLRIDIQNPSLLIRSEVYHKGWKVFIDGKKQDVIRVNFLQQGVWLDKGTHTVEFKFFPQSMKYGFIVSAVFLLFLILIMIIAFNIKKSNKKKLIR
ncbi:MAG: YfhO family protein, partial [Spirochaetes bacterium]|nr:YfhO family protein [Spirochaetota bacterium]